MSHLSTTALATMVRAASTDGSVMGARILEAAVLATASLGTILLGGAVATAPEAVLLARSGEVGGTDKPSWEDASKDATKSSWEFWS